MKKLIFAFIIILILSAGSTFAEDNLKISQFSAKKEKELDRLEKEFSKIFDLQTTKRLVNSKKNIKKILMDISLEEANFQLSMQKAEKAEEKISKIQKKINYLKNQLKNLNLQIETVQKRINIIERQIGIRKIDLISLQSEKEKIETIAENQSNVLLNYYKTMQKENLERGKDEIKNTLKLLLADNSFADHLRNKVYLSSWEKTERQIFHNLERSLHEVHETVILVKKEKKQFKKLQKSLEKEKAILSLQKTAKNNLIKQTSGQQEEYKKLWEKSKKEMFSSIRSIKNLQNEYDQLRAKLNTLEKKHQENLEHQKYKQENINFEIGKIFEENDNKKIPFIWPIDPQKGISAYFEDKQYKKRFNLEHKAIDIKCPQKTPIKAPDLGYVYEIVDNGFGYSYLILAHKNNLITVYGHLTKFLVSKGDIVQKGDIIGLSGGTPGTKGAGLITTGPHLHFEVIDNGSHKNPLYYLPAINP